MQSPLQITFHSLQHSEALADVIRQHATKLEQHFPRLLGCRVSVEEPNHHHRQGKGNHFRVCVALSVPGETLVASREAPQIVSNEDAYRAVAKAFAAALRMLETHSERVEGRAKARRIPQKMAAARLRL